jgi:hypothetical protein
MERKAGKPKIRQEILTVLIVGVLGSLGAIYIGQRALAVTESESAQLTAIGMAVEPIVGAVLLWVGYTLGMHIIARRYGGHGVIRRLLKTTAWALIPVGVGNLLRSGTFFLTYRGIDPQAVSIEGPNSDVVQAFADAGVGEPLYLVGQVLLLFGVLWSGYLMTHAVQWSKDLDWEGALRTAAVPVAIHALYVLWVTVESFGLVG